MMRAYLLVAAVAFVSFAALAQSHNTGSSKMRLTNDQEVTGQKRHTMGIQIGDAGQNPTPIRLSKAASTALNIGDVDGGTARTFTMTLTGAAVNDPVACTFPSNTPEDIMAMCWVSATNTVSFKVRNTNTLNVMTLDGGASSIYGARILR